MLADPEELDIQKLAVELLARLPTPALADGLATLPAQPEVRAGLPQALSALPAPVSVGPPPAAVRMMPQGSDSSVRASAIAALHVLNNAGPDKHLRQAMEGSVQRLVASMPAEAFDKVLSVGGGGTGKVLPDTAVLDSVLHHLPAEQLRLHVPLLMSLLRDPRASVKERVVYMLLKLDASDLAKLDPALLLPALLNAAVGVRLGALQLVCRPPPERLAPCAAEVLRMLWDSNDQVREVAMDGTLLMLKTFQTPAMKEQLRCAAVDACTRRELLGTLR
jgi:hypothetical protein